MAVRPAHLARPNRGRPGPLPTLAVAAVLLALTAAFVPGAAAQAPPAGDPVRIEVLSNRADLISGGDALVEIVLPAGADAAGLRVDAGGRDVTELFGVRDHGRVIGLLTGLPLGETVLTASLPDGRGARIPITNHPAGGPVFSGPQIQPWRCATGALDDQCSREPTLTFLYRSSNPAVGGLQDYDPSNPPTDVAEVTTDTGATVPFIVRSEVGVLARDEYRIAVLFDPARPFEPWAPQPGFNRTMVITHGASCDTHYEQASAPGVLNEALLERGYVVMSHALNNAGHNCNIVTQAEAMVMTKERVIEQFGPLRYTIGTGCSGGALAQQQVANAYPGLYQGITVGCSYPDAWSSAMQYVDYDRILAYLGDPTGWEPGVVWDPLSISQILGHPNPSNPITFTTVIPNSGRPSRDCVGVDAPDVYDADTNPGGVRCSLHDYMINVFGAREADGFARRPADNVGIQYGLDGLLAGTLLPANFVDINTKLGGVDIDYNYTPERSPGDPLALQRAYRSGAVNTATNLDQVAIIDYRGPDPGAFHDVYRTYALRERLEREHGTAGNQILWRGTVPLLGDATYADEAVFAMDRWLAAVEADTRDVPLARRIIESRPDDVTDRCTTGAGQDVPAAYCDTIVERYETPRIVAGMPTTDDVLKCELKPLDRDDYPAGTFTDAQWARLQQAFPTGVCDWTRPDPHRVDTVPWLTYAAGPGGQPLGNPPVSAATGTPAADVTPVAQVTPVAGLPATGGGALALALGALAAAAGVHRTRHRRVPS
jgi:hypothetical protein